jgi:hypothetical protein
MFFLQAKSGARLLFKAGDNSSSVESTLLLNQLQAWLQAHAHADE